ncbi:GDP-mannose 4,6-dehydratase [Patescibacteria group bacterium]|nr:GDP-mannose 4,6-dehydratase [Patescibacteria group bacterium]
MKKIALITGITGQDGSYLAEFLLEKGYKVYGLIRRTSLPNTARIKNILDKIELIEGDLTDQRSLDHSVMSAQADEVYNLAAQSFNETSWKEPKLTVDVDGLGTLRMLEAVKLGINVLKKEIKIYLASSCQIFGKPSESPQNEYTAFSAQSPYAAAKLYGHLMTRIYRENYKMFAVNGITFNHESPRRSVEFVSKKISREVAKIYLGLSKELMLGNLTGKRDWGYAGDFVKAMWLMLQQKKAEDYVISTGESHTVKEFVQEAFSFVNLDWKKYVKQDSRFIRKTTDENPLLGDSSKAYRNLGWKPKVKFKELVQLMVEYDIKELSKQNLNKKK